MVRRFLALPLLAALFALLAPHTAQAASGGGCRNTYDVGVCVSYSSTYKRVSGDFYLNSNTWDSCTAKLYIRVNGTWHYKYLVVLDHIGRYPEGHVPVSGSGSAYTKVELYDCAGRFQYQAFSPTLYYP
ncbi:hypothetical protein [Saccharothrix sp.]|uniref:hypothetical protein n=1 Tax=Saccharothrix sp. TaxID=1873460 RepID=UPI0028112696|nr:hypothetical protein [Saccharothrix sp.]